MATIFLSHSSADEPLVRQLEKWLVASGFDDVFVDLTMRGGDKWPESLRNAKASCRVVLCMVTPSWLASAECEGEFSAAWYMGRRIIPLVALKGATLDTTQERRRARVLGEDQGFDITPAIGPDGRLDLDGHPEIAEPLKAGLRAGGALAKVGLDPEAFEIDPAKRPAPFPGLESFGDDDADAAVFFGRSPEIAELLERLREMRASGELKPLVVLGASGSGKSSLVKAGVLPRLRRERAWLVLRSFRPGADPIYNLADAVARTFADYGVTRAAGPIRNSLRDAWRAAPRQGPRDRRPGFATDEGLAAINIALTQILNELRRLSGRPGATALIALDQGEEVARGEGESADALCDVLRAALLPSGTSADGVAPAGCRLILSCRTDSFAELQSAPRFEGLECISADIRAVPIYRYDNAVEGPALRYGVQIEYSLVEALMEDSPGEDALPLLAFALERLWRQFAAERRIRKDYYDSLGKLEGLIEDAAERALRGIKPGEEAPIANLSADKDALGARTFVPALAQVSDRGSTIRRVAPWTAFDGPARDLLELFASWRLVVKKGGEDDSTVEVAHETIFRAWRRFIAWLEPEKARLEALRGVESAARLWDRSGRRGDDLTHRARRLREARALEKHVDFAKLIEKSDAPVRAYLAACRGAEFRRGLLAGTGVAALFVAVAGGVFWVNAYMWRTEMKIQAQRFVRPPTRAEAVAYSLAAFSPPGSIMRAESGDATAVMESLGLRVPGRDLGKVVDGHLSGNGEWLVTRRYAPDGSYQGRLWNLREDSEPVTLGSLPGEVAGYSDDGRWLVMRSYRSDGSYTGELIDIQDVEAEPRDLGPLDSWRFSPDGTWLVASGYLSNVGRSVTKLWDLRTTDEGEELAGVDSASIQFTEDGANLFYREYSTESGYVGRLRGLGKGGQTRDLGSTESWQVTADGDWLVTGGYTETGGFARLWDLRAGGEPRDLGNVDPYSLLLSADGGVLYGGGYDDFGASWSRLWDLHDGGKAQDIENLNDDQGRYVDSREISSDGNWLVVRGSSAQTYEGQLLSLQDDAPPIDLGRVDSYSTQFSSDGLWLYSAVVGDDGVSHGRLYDLRGGGEPEITESVDSWQMSADNAWMVTASYNAAGGLRGQLWNLAEGGQPLSLGSLDLFSYQFSPDSASLFVHAIAPDGSYLGEVRDLRNGGESRDLGKVDAWYYSPSGEWLLTQAVTPEGAVRVLLLNMHDGREVDLGGVDGYSLQFSADEGRVFARPYANDGGFSGMTWDLRNGGDPTPIAGAETALLSPDGAWLVSSGYTPEGYYEGQLWNLRDGGEPLSLGQVDSYGTTFASDSRWVLVRSYTPDGLSSGRLYDLTQGASPLDIGDAQSWQISLDGRWLSVSGYSADGTYRTQLLDAAADWRPSDLFTDASGEILGFSPDSRWMVARQYDENGIYSGLLIDLHGEKAPVALGQMDNWLISPDSAWVVTTGYSDDGLYESRVWRTDGGREPVDLGEIDSYSPQFSEDGNWLIVKTYSSVDGSYQGRLINLRDGGEPRELGSSETVQISADGAWLFNLGATPIEYWGELHDLSSGGDPLPLGPTAYSQLSPDGAFLVTAGPYLVNGSDAQLWDLRGGGEPRSLGNLDTSYLQYSADGDWLFSAGYEADGSYTGRLWDLRNGGDPLELGAVDSPTLSADGAWLFAREYAADGTYKGKLWDLRNGGASRDIGAVEDWALSADGAQFLTMASYIGGNYDARLWNLQAPMIEGGGAALREGACEASRMLPFSSAARLADPRLQGRPWHPCDWRGLLPSIEDGWEGARQWERLVRVRLGLADDYACAETNAAGESNPLRVQMCREAGEDAALPEAPPAPAPASSAKSVERQPG